MMTQAAVSKNNRNVFFDGLFVDHIAAEISSRECGNMSINCGDTYDSLKNRQRFLKKMGVDQCQLVCAKQVHGCQVKLVEKEDAAKGALSYDTAIADTDALITKIRGLPIAIFTADCLPLFLYDPSTESIGLVHAGWKGTKENIAAKTVSQMKRRFNSVPGDLYAWMGPGIGKCCYAVGPEFDPLFSSGLIKKNNRVYLDLAGVNKKQLLVCGVKDKNINESNICTVCDNKDFFSYRKDGPQTGRMMSVMMLK